MDHPEPEHRLARREAFGAVARAYAQHRPRYPAALFDAVALEGGLSAGARVLEVAPGPGNATAGLLSRGWSVDAVELSAELASVAADGLAAEVAGGRLRVHVAPFEGWPLPEEPYDAVFCATAWHWLDPAVRVPKAARALRPAGVLAVVWTHHVAGGTDGFDGAAAPLFRRWAPQTAPWQGLPSEQELQPQTAQLSGSSAFCDVTSRLFPVEVTYTPDEVAALHGTYSDVLRLDRPAREALLSGLRDLAASQPGGRVVRRYAFELVLARRRSS